jgi:hypothetical protein
MAAVQIIASTLRFLLELAFVGALVYWAVVTQPGIVILVVGALALGLVSVTWGLLWGIFIAPHAPPGLRVLAKLIPDLLRFGLGALALSAAGQPLWGVALFTAFVLDRLLLRVFGVPDWAPPS